MLWTGDYRRGMDSYDGTQDEADDGRRLSYSRTVWTLKAGPSRSGKPPGATTLYTMDGMQPRPYIRWTVCSHDPIYSDEADDDPQCDDGRLAALPRVYTTQHMVPAIGPLTQTYPLLRIHISWRAVIPSLIG